MAEKAQAKREARLNCIFLLLLVANLAVIAVATAALVLTPRPLQRWVAAICALVTALGTLTSLTALNQGVNYQRRSRVCLFLLGNTFALLLCLGSMALVLWGLGEDPDQMRLAVSIPLLVALLILFLLSLWNTIVAVGYARLMPRHPPDSAQVRYTESRAAYSNGVMYNKDAQRVSTLPNGTLPHNGNGTLANGHNGIDYNANLNTTLNESARSRASYASYSASETPRVESLRPAGSLHSVLTMTSDL